MVKSISIWRLIVLILIISCVEKDSPSPLDSDEVQEHKDSSDSLEESSENDSSDIFVELECSLAEIVKVEGYDEAKWRVLFSENGQIVSVEESYSSDNNEYSSEFEFDDSSFLVRRNYYKNGEEQEGFSKVVYDEMSRISFLYEIFHGCYWDQSGDCGYLLSRYKFHYDNDAISYILFVDSLMSEYGDTIYFDDLQNETILEFKNSKGNVTELASRDLVSNDVHYEKNLEYDSLENPFIGQVHLFFHYQPEWMASFFSQNNPIKSTIVYRNGNKVEKTYKYGSYSNSGMPLSFIEPNAQIKMSYHCY